MMIVSLLRDYDTQRKRRGITASPIASLYRGWHTFGALLIVQDTLTPDMLVVRWLCRDVDEQTAREAIEAWQNGNNTQTTL